MTDLGYQLQWNNAVLTNGIPIAADYPRPNAVAQSEVPTIPNLQASTITISPDGRFLAVSLAAPPFDVQIWSIDQGCLLSRLEGHLIGARWLKFFPDGNRLRSTAWDDLEMKIWDTSALTSLQISPNTGFLRLDCPCTMTFSLDTAHTPEWSVWKVWRIAPDCSWAAMTRGDGKIAFYNSKTREKYSAFVTYEVDPSAERPEKMFNEIDLSFITPTTGVMIGLTDVHRQSMEVRDYTGLMDRRLTDEGMQFRRVICSGLLFWGGVANASLDIVSNAGITWVKA
ncbi:hypothetical protein FS837_003367 [Tulasnella sp. UAMH 9824]|nr:hypothetical protein FS837_003367 [Tulasnella sp. UAMH 9824]